MIIFGQKCADSIGYRLYAVPKTPPRTTVREIGRVMQRWRRQAAGTEGGRTPSWGRSAGRSAVDRWPVAGTGRGRSDTRGRDRTGVLVPRALGSARSRH